MSIYIKIGDLEGESTDADHKGWIDVASLSHGISRPIDSQGSGGAYRTSANMSEIQLSKVVDKVTPKLIEAICQGKAFPTVKIDFVTSVGDDKRVPYQQIELTNGRITSYNVSGGEGASHEGVSLSYEKYKLTYTPYDKAGKPQGKVETTWDLEKGAKS